MLPQISSPQNSTMILTTPTPMWPCPRCRWGTLAGVGGDHPPPPLNPPYKWTIICSRITTWCISICNMETWPQLVDKPLTCSTRHTLAPTICTPLHPSSPCTPISRGTQLLIGWVPCYRLWTLMLSIGTSSSIDRRSWLFVFNVFQCFHLNWNYFWKICRNCKLPSPSYTKS